MQHSRWLRADLTVTALACLDLRDKIVINYYLIGTLMDNRLRFPQAGESRIVMFVSGGEFAGEQSQARQHSSRNPVKQLSQRGAYP